MTDETRNRPGGPWKSGQALELTSLRQEYQNGFDRSNKLDNKVYIVITFCGFLFVFITELFSGLTQLRWPQAPLPTVLAMLYVGSCLAVMLAYVGVLIFFLGLLRPEKIHRVDPCLLEQAALEALPEPEATACLVGLYRQTVNENLDRLHRRCDRFTLGLRYVVGMVALAFLAYGARVLLLIVQ